jgi:hypothetical protein
MLLFPFIGLLTGSLAYMVWDQNWGSGKDYKSEWLAKDSLNGLIILMVVSNAILFALLSLPFFLNNRYHIRNNLVLNFLTWFALPFSWIIYLLVKAKIFDGINSDNGWVLINILPFLLSLITGFLVFRIRFNKKPW